MPALDAIVVSRFLRVSFLLVIGRVLPSCQWRDTIFGGSSEISGRMVPAGATAATVAAGLVSMDDTGSRSDFARVSSGELNNTGGSAASTIIAGGTDVPVTTFIKTNGPRPKKQKAISHAVRATINIPENESME